MADIYVARVEEYPKDNPESYVVGFNVKVSEDKSFYIEDSVPLNEASDSLKAIDMVYSKCETRIKEKILSMSKESIKMLYKTLNDKDLATIKEVE